MGQFFYPLASWKAASTFCFSLFSFCFTYLLIFSVWARAFMLALLGLRTGWSARLLSG